MKKKLKYVHTVIFGILGSYPAISNVTRHPRSFIHIIRPCPNFLSSLFQPPHPTCGRHPGTCYIVRGRWNCPMPDDIRISERKTLERKVEGERDKERFPSAWLSPRWSLLQDKRSLFIINYAPLPKLPIKNCSGRERGLWRSQ